MADASDVQSKAPSIPGKSSDYLACLSPDDKKRFEEKLKVCVGEKLLAFHNPYEDWDDEQVWNDSPGTSKCRHKIRCSMFLGMASLVCISFQ